MGELSVVKTPKSSPVTRSMMKLPVKPAGIGTVLIYDGKVERQQLDALGLQENWLEQEIAKKGFSTSQVLLSTLRKYLCECENIMNKLIEFFQSTEHLSNAGFAERTIVSIILIYFMSRFLMKRAAGQFIAFDFVFLWMLGALAVAPLLDGKILFTTTIMATATLYLWHFIISWLGVRNRAFAKLIRRKPTILVEKGKIIENNMRQTFFNNDLLLSEMRLAEAHDLKEVDQVILETSGHLSVVKKSEHVPPTSIDFNIPVPPGGLPTILVNNGKVFKII